jgi:UDP-glucose 4-epimerase
MKILVTGASGFIGRNTCRMLKDEGHAVVGVDIRPSVLPIVHYQEDITDGEAIRRIFEQEEPDAVLHLAAQISVPDSVEDPIFDMEQNIRGSLMVFEAARRTGTKRVVFSSSAAVYGDTPIPPIREDAPLEPTSPYGLSKLAVEQYLSLFYSKYFSYGILRYGNAYGPNQDVEHGGVLTKFIHGIKTNNEVTIFGDGNQKRDFIHIDDLGRANILALTSHENFIVNIGCSVPTTVLELVRIMEELLGRKIEVQYRPPRAGDIEESYFDVTRAKQVLKWQPTIAIQDGIRALLKQNELL